MENESPNNECKRSDWQRSHSLIERSIARSIEKDGRLPTYREMEVETGLSQATIARHRPGEIFEGMRMMSRLLGEEVLTRQALRALATGNGRDVELYLKLNFGNV